MKTHTHKKRSYRAHAVQWDGVNTWEICDMMPSVTPYASALMVRYHGGIKTMKKGDWAVKGEDGKVKIYSDEVFKIKYESI